MDKQNDELSCIRKRKCWVMHDMKFLERHFCCWIKSHRSLMNLISLQSFLLNLTEFHACLHTAGSHSISYEWGALSFPLHVDTVSSAPLKNISSNLCSADDRREISCVHVLSSHTIKSKSWSVATYGTILTQLDWFPLKMAEKYFEHLLNNC